MDKKIVDKLIQFGLITNIGIDANKYTDVDDLIAKGIVTVPGAKAKIMELIGDDHIVVEEVPVKEVKDDVVDDVVVDAPAEAEITEEEVVVEEVVKDDVNPEDETTVVESETTKPEVKVESEIIVETPNKSKKSKKN